MYKFVITNINRPSLNYPEIINISRDRDELITFIQTGIIHKQHRKQIKAQ